MKVEKNCKYHGNLSEENIIIEQDLKLKSGISLRCRLCKIEKDRKWKNTHRDQHIQSSIKWKKENIEKYREWQAKDRKENPEKYKQYQENYKNKHGNRKTTLEIIRVHSLTIEDYAQMIVDQKNLCAICNLSETRKSRTEGKITRLAVDHCHKTGQVRGLLCHECNTMLGKAKDSIEILEKAIEYLKKHTCK